MKVIIPLAALVGLVLVSCDETRTSEATTPGARSADAITAQAARVAAIQSDSDATGSGGVGNYSSGAVACMAEAMYYESKKSSETGMRAVGEVLVNRKNSPKFPNTICGVTEQRYNGSCQFSYKCDGKPENMPNAASRQLAMNTARSVLAGNQAKVAPGALFFRASWLAPNGWWRSLTRIGTYGGNVFYR